MGGKGREKEGIPKGVEEKREEILYTYTQQYGGIGIGSLDWNPQQNSSQPASSTLVPYLVPSSKCLAEWLVSGPFPFLSPWPFSLQVLRAFPFHDAKATGILIKWALND